MDKHKDRGPAVKIPPPLIFLSFALLGWGFDHIYHLPVFVSLDMALLLAGLLGGLSVVTILWAVLSFLRHRTHIEPWKPASYLITSGIFRYSRNPIYLGFILLVVATGLYFQLGWIVISVIPSLWCLTHLVIYKEERYLHERFGEDYLRYKSCVRRWL